MFQKGTFPASAVAVDDVETLFLPAEALFALVTENPEMALRMLAALSLRLRMFAHKLAAQGQGGAACRLATYLLHRRQIGGGDCIRLGVSREVLANLLGLARETLSRQLSRFSEAGLVELRGKDIVILAIKFGFLSQMYNFHASAWLLCYVPKEVGKCSITTMIGFINTSW